MLYLLGFSVSGCAAEISIAPNQLPVALGQYLDYLPDPDRSLTIDRILDDPDGFDWQRSSQNIPTLGISNSAHWFHVRIQPRELTDRDNLVMTIDSPIIDRIEIYQSSNGVLRAGSVLGDTIPLSELEIPLRIPTVRLVSDTGDTPIDIYFRATSSSGVEFPLVINDLEKLLSEQQGEMAYYGAFFTFLALCIAGCAIIYLYLRDSLFAAITVFFIFGTVFFLTLTGIGRLWLWPESAELNTRLSFIAGSVLTVCFAIIGRTIDLKSPLQDSVNLVLRIVAIGMLAAAIYFLVIPFEKINRDTVLPVMVMGFIMALTVMSMAGIAAIRGSRTAIYLFLSWALMLLSYILTLFYKFEFIQRTPLITSFGNGCFIIAALLILASLGEFIRNKREDYQNARLDARAKNDFLRNVSREILTPVHLVLANSKRLLGSSTEIHDGKARDHLNTIIKQSNHLHSLINDLLEMAELESESFEPQFELVEMSRFLNETRELMRKSAEEKNLKFETSFASANLLLQTDRARLQHALIKLINNAVKYTDQGTITLAYRAIYYHRHLGIEIAVKDTGRGMHEETRQRLFNEFFRATPGSELEPNGTGLGLVIVRRMVTKLGGEIDFESRLGKGSEFFIRLPLRHASD